MRISSVLSGRVAIVSALALLVGCASVIVLNPCEGGSGGAEPQGDADPCGAANLADGLVAYYPFDGDTNDATGHGLNGVPAGNIDFIEGKIGQALFLQEKGARVTVAEAPALDTTEEFTLSAWVNPTFYPTKLGDNPVIISKLFASDIIGNYVLNVQVVDADRLLDAFGVEYVDTPDDGGAGKLVVDGVWVTDDPAAPTWIPLGVWTQVTATFNHGSLKLYIDGKLVAQKESDVPHTERTHYDHEDVNIGNTYGSGHDYTWYGAIDDVRIYGRALSADEAACLGSGK